MKNFAAYIFLFTVCCLSAISAAAQPSTFYNLFTMPGSSSTNFCPVAPATCVKSAPEGGYLVAGAAADTYPATQDVCLIRTDSLGDTLWVRRIGGVQQEQGRMICPAAGNSWIIPFQGYTISGQQDHLGAIRIGDNGDTIWARSFGIGTGSGAGCSVVPTFDGNYMLTGATQLNTGSVTHLVKFDINGNMIWGKTLRIAGSTSVTEHFYCWRVAETPDHGFLLGGFCTNINTNTAEDNVLVKTDSAGNVLWTVSYGLPSVYDRLNDFCFAPNGDILTVSYHELDDPGYAARFTSTGQLIWAKMFTDSRTISICPLGTNFLIGGQYTPLSAAVYHPLGMAIDGNGNVVWAKAYDVNSNRNALAQYATVAQGRIAFTGISDPGYAGPWGIFLAGADLNGNSCNSANVTMPVTTHTLSIDTPSVVPYTNLAVQQLNYTAGVLAGINVTNACSSVTGITETEVASFTIFPVPNNGQFTIDLHSALPGANVVITDCMGKTVVQQLISGDTQVDISAELAGIYFVRVYSNENRLAGVSRIVLAK